MPEIPIPQDLLKVMPVDFDGDEIIIGQRGVVKCLAD
jgi:hypothetical protein